MAPIPRRRRRRVPIALGVVLVLLIGAITAWYGLLSVPLPKAAKTPQTTTVFYAGGRTPMALFAAEDREIVPLRQVPVGVRRAVLAAEDRSFYSNNGISYSGLARAIVGLATGQDRGGGSTITQQYVKNSRLTPERSFTRKMREIAMAIKLDREYSKETILELYLNTIYFGRGAYGIQTAAKAYFGTDVSKLTAEQGAVLAAAIKDPTNLDPRNNPAGARKRWNYVMDGMTAEGWYPQGKRAAAAYPAATAPRRRDWQNGQNGVLADAVLKEVTRRLRIVTAAGAPDPARAEKLLSESGFRVYTTIDIAVQNAAVQAAKRELTGQDPSIAAALVAVEPSTGRIRAYYGGDQGYGRRDLASRSRPHPPGTSMEPYALVTAFQSGTGSLQDALQRSQGNDVKDVAEKAGITRMGTANTTQPIGEVDIDDRIGIGQYPVPVVEQAAGYATFAAGGRRHDPYLVEKIADPSGKVIYQHQDEATAAIPRFAAEITAKVLRSADSGASDLLARGRPAVAAAGHQPGNANLWMCGYAAQLATAVWVGHQEADSRLTFDTGESMDERVPATIWSQFMDAALAGAPVREL